MKTAAVLQAFPITSNPAFCQIKGQSIHVKNKAGIPGRPKLNDHAPANAHQKCVVLGFSGRLQNQESTMRSFSEFFEILFPMLPCMRP